MKVREAAKEMVLDTKGNVSSKRIIVFATFGLLSVVVLAHTFFGFELSEFIFDGLVYVILGGLGVTTAEHFSSGAKQNGKKNGKQLLVEQES